jgi:hypothetical protein
MDTKSGSSAGGLLALRRKADELKVLGAGAGRTKRTQRGMCLDARRVRSRMFCGAFIVGEGGGPQRARGLVQLAIGVGGRVVGVEN